MFRRDTRRQSNKNELIKLVRISFLTTRKLMLTSRQTGLVESLENFMTLCQDNDDQGPKTMIYRRTSSDDALDYSWIPESAFLYDNFDISLGCSCRRFISNIKRAIMNVFIFEKDSRELFFCPIKDKQ